MKLCQRKDLSQHKMYVQKGQLHKMTLVISWEIIMEAYLSL